MTKIQILNERLSAEQSVGIRLLFTPLVLIVDSKTGTIRNPLHLYENSSDVSAYYSTIVYITDDPSIAVWEFGPTMLAGLQGYSNRYNIYDIELLLSREKNGDQRITIGRNSDLESLASEQVRLKPMADKLSDKYMEKVGYKLHDFKSI